MKLHLLAATATLIALAPAVSAQTPPVSAKLGAAARAAIFKAAGAVQRGGKWIICKEDPQAYGANIRSEEHTSELQSLMRISYAVFCLKKKKQSTKSI